MLVNKLLMEIPKIEFNGGHIGFMLIIEITKLELTGGHIGYTKYTHCLNKINWRPY